MDFQQDPNQPAARPGRQFSVRDLLRLTLIVSILLMIGVLARGTEHFRAFSTAPTAVSLLPVVMVLVAYRWRLVSRRKLVVASVLGYVAALCLPSVGGGSEIEFGAQLALTSFAGLPHLWDSSVRANIGYGGAPVPIVIVTIETSLIIACALGAAANVAYWIGVVSCWLGRKRPRARRVACRAATLATSLAILAIVAMCLDTNIETFYPGCGLWIASFLALALATR
jgi:hypothetical protein